MHNTDFAAQAHSALQQLLAQPPPQLQELHLEVDEGVGFDHEVLTALDASGLQQLRKLVVAGPLPELSVLPAQLQQLDLGYCEYEEQLLAAVMPLQQLTALSFIVGFEEPEPLLLLAQLPALQELRLAPLYMDWRAAVATAPAWGQLPQLRELETQFGEGVAGTWPQLMAVVAGVAAATALTKLVLWVPDLIDLIDLTGGDDEQAGVNDEGGQQQGPLDVCASIAGLTRLKELDAAAAGN
ncbi:hypothetical protein OEZ86_012405 [Tetradesmus obliquus]|nr:hypothetical protein OEZ86_012405 [Tetradesmus obliquus]